MQDNDTNMETGNDANESVKTGVSETGKDTMTIEEGFAYLDKAVERLSKEDISLEESFSVFEKGMKVLKEVSGKIDAVEKKVKVITGDGEISEFQ